MIKLYTLPLLAGCVLFSAQSAKIDTVFIDHQLLNTEKVGKIQKIDSKDFLKNATSLSDVLMFQTPIYIKENGRGMVSSPSFRGTTSQQTAFLWNGINVNSQFLGQGDINNLSLLSYDHIDVKYGGGSVVYGSGAIGGSIHLNNDLIYNRGFKNKFFAEYGSFNTINTFYKSSYSQEKLTTHFTINYSNSDNNYKVEERYYNNRNGAYNNVGVNFGLGYKVANKHEVYVQSQLFDAEQNYPILSEFATPTKYENQNFRSLLGWKYKDNTTTNDLKLAFIKDQFQYFSELNKPKTSAGITSQYIVKNDFNFDISAKGKLNIITELNHTKGEGYGSGISEISRNQLSAALQYRQQINRQFYAEIGLKQDFVEDVKSPFLYSVGFNFSPNNWYNTKLGFSKNFRFPSFNDLYWQPGGNLDLKSETSQQLEMTHQFKLKNWSLEVSPYYILIRDMIRWLPTNFAIWAPTNTSKVESFGLETQVKYIEKFGDFTVSGNLIYAFTNSENQDTKKQLMYVPKHKSTFNANLDYKKLNVFTQILFNGKAFVDSEENNSTALDPYTVVNVGAKYKLVKNVELGFKVNNITNQIYLTTEAYYMPKRNYSVNLLLNF